MSWENREYAQSGQWRDPSPLGLNWPRGALRVIAIAQIVGWLLSLSLRESVPGAGHYLNGITAAAKPRPASILVHPLTPAKVRWAGGVGVVLATVLLQMSLGRVIQEHAGPKQMVWMFVVGNFLAGLAYFAVMPFAPLFASAPLDWPAGGFAAWAYWGWRNLRFEFVPVGEKLHPLSRLIGFGAIVVLVIEATSWGPGAMNWVLCVAFGGLAVFITPLLENRVRWPSFRSSPGRATARTLRIRPLDDRDFDPIGADTETRPGENADRSGATAEERELDALLAKISSGGLASLTREERERLESLRRARLERAR